MVNSKSLFHEKVRRTAAPRFGLIVNEFELPNLAMVPKELRGEDILLALRDSAAALASTMPCPTSASRRMTPPKRQHRLS